jgi:hypothetical protein
VDTPKWFGYGVIAFIGYELLAYFINRSVWQKAVTTGDYSGQMPLDFLGQMIGYGPGPAGGDSSGAALALPAPITPPGALPLFKPVPIPAPTATMPDILFPDASTPPFVTWPGGA